MTLVYATLQKMCVTWKY